MGSVSSAFRDRPLFEDWGFVTQIAARFQSPHSEGLPYSRIATMELG